MRRLKLNNKEHDLVIDAIAWYAADRRECDKHSDDPLDNHIEIAEEAETLLEKLNRKVAGD